MVALTTDKEVAALRADGALNWLRRHRRDHFFPQMAYGEQRSESGDRDEIMGTPSVRRLLEVVRRMDSRRRHLLHALVSENPREALKVFAEEKGLTVADIRIHLTAAVTAVACFFRGRA